MDTVKPYIVLNVACDRILGFYDTWEEAEAEARRFGACSFPYQLSQSERTQIARIRAEQ